MNQTSIFTRTALSINEEFCHNRAHERTITCNNKNRVVQTVGHQRFRASTGWLYGIFRGYKLSSRLCTIAISKVNSGIPDYTAEKKLSFYLHVKGTAFTQVWLHMEHG
jgi:hypothetical protein